MQMIGLTGRAGSGKTTIANWLCSDFGFVNVALADPIKEGLKAMLGISNERLNSHRLKDQPIGWINRSPRELMQSLGTDCGRHVAENIWLRVADLRIDRIMQLPNHMHVGGIVVSDIRFENEADWLRAKGGNLWHINRSSCFTPTIPAANHISEQSVHPKSGEPRIYNNGTLDQLYELIGEMVTEQ